MKKKILVLTSTYPRWPGDKEPQFIYRLCQLLSKDFRVTILTPHSRGAKRYENEYEITIIRFPYFFKKWQSLAYQGGILSKLKAKPARYLLVPFFLLSELLHTMILLRQGAFDLIHAHWLIPQGIVAIIASRLAKTPPPVICTSHGGDLYGLRGPFFVGLKRYILHRVAAVTVVSHAMHKDIRKLGISGDKTQVIPMGTDLQSRFVPTQWQRNLNSLLFVGRLVEKKGVRFLLEAMPEILSTVEDVHLTIVGEGPEKEGLISLIQTLGIENVVTFAGGVEHNSLASLYQKATILVFPSIIASDGDREGFGLVPVEAMGCECPVIVSDLEAMQDFVQDGKTGLVFQQKNPHDLAVKIISLLRDPELQGSIGMAGRKSVVRRYDWQVIYQKYRDLILSILPNT